MTTPKVFVSSTCHDLKAIRSDLRDFILSYGFEPIMSDFGDIHYDPKQNTHESCLEAIEGSDLVIFLVGARFGSSADSLQSNQGGEEHRKDFLSITQKEVERAQEKGIYVYTFIERGVYHDYWVYKSNSQAKQSITYPSIHSQEHSPYIFDFIDVINRKNSNNAIFEFSTPADIKVGLKRQWGQLFRKLLSERKNYKTKDEFQDELTQKLNELKAAIIESHNGSEEKKSEINDFINHRMLIAFCYTLNPRGYKVALEKQKTWREILLYLGVTEVRAKESIRRHFYFNMERGVYFRCNHSVNYLNEVKNKWFNFKSLSVNSKKKVIQSIPEGTLKNNNTALSKDKGIFKAGDDVTDNFLNEETVDEY